MSALVIWWALAVVTLTGAVAVLLARETARLILGLGCFLLGMAGFYAYYAMTFLAAAQVFVYVGGVLVLFLFAITALRSGEGRSGALPRRFDIGAASVAVGSYVVLAIALREVSAGMAAVPVVRASTEGLAKTLLGPLLPQFEIAGLVLLIALVTALVAAGGEERR